MKRLIALFLLCTPVCAIAAYPVETGEIISLQVHKLPDSSSESANRFMVRLSGTISENLCGGDQWSGYLGSDAGKTQYSTLLAAHMAGKEIKIEGTAPDKCDANNLLIRNVYIAW